MKIVRHYRFDPRSEQEYNTAIIRLKDKYPNFRNLTSFRRTAFEAMLGRTCREFQEWLDENYNNAQVYGHKIQAFSHLKFHAERGDICFETNE